MYFTTHFSKTAKVTTYFFILTGLSCLIGGILLLIYFNAKGHLPLNTTINGIQVGNLTIEEAKTKLETELLAPSQHLVRVRVDDIEVASNSSELKAKYDVDRVILPLVGTPEKSHVRSKVVAVLTRYFTPQERTVPISYDEAELEKLLTALAQKVFIPNQDPQITLARSGVVTSLKLFEGSTGRTVDRDQLKTLLIQQAQATDLEIVAPVASTGAVLTEAEAAQSMDRASKIVGKSILFTKEGIPFTLNDIELVSFLKLPSGIQSSVVAKTVSSWEETINRPPQEPEFEYDAETLAVSKFVPPRNGLTLDVEKTTELVAAGISELEQQTDPAIKTVEKKLPLAELPPKTSLGSLNKLGITERIGFGESYYAHSIPNRIHNVALATGRISLHIVKPGEEFSFNKTLGDVSGATGFKSAYVIQGNRTVLGDGGGVCQVSSTLFRAVLNAGLDVTRRLPHSYRVSYYELNSKPGIDATVYSGETDFRFINDTDHAILIYGESDSKNLYMYYELYGTSDGRTAEIVDHKTWNFRPAPPAVYIDDPTLPPGKVVQVDWAAAGVSASFKNVVRDKTGKIISEDTYVSNYRPWSAKYLRGIAQ